MKNKYLNKLIVLAIITSATLIPFLGCEKNDSGKCKPNQNCTEEFRTIIVTVKYSDETPVELDSIKVFDTWSGVEITSINTNNLISEIENGDYILFDDTHLSTYRTLEIKVTFKGYKDGVLLTENVFEVGADCCHVYAISENLTITIDK